MMLAHHLHELQEVSVMLLRGMAIEAYIIMYGNYAREMVCYLVHVHLGDVMGHLHAKRHMQELIPATMGIESGQV